ncbi:MAG: single-stranded DNA-binding protein [Bacillota bacterium]
MLNRIIIIGRLTRDPELRYTESGRAVTNFTLAVERNFKNTETGEREVDFIKVTVWQKLAENCAKYLKKGSLAAAEGQLYINKDKGKDGRTYTNAFVNARNVRFLSFDNDSGGSSNDENLEEDIENRF